MADEKLKFIKKMYPDGDVNDERIEYLHAGWGSRTAQDLRYAAMLKILNELTENFFESNNREPRILEIGCGFGVGFSRMEFKEGYCGIDINPQAIEYCKHNYPEDKFHLKDICSEQFLDFVEDIRPDYIIASGVFDHLDIWRMVKEKQLLHRILDKIHYAVVATMLHDVTPEKYRNPLHAQYVVYSSPLDIFELFRKEIYAQNIFFQFKNDYMDNDYTFALVKKNQLLLNKDYQEWARPGKK